jgi:hypothetical protein
MVLGSWLYQSAALALVHSPTTFCEAFVLNLGTRGIQFAIILTLEVTIIYLLFTTKVCNRLGIWPPKTKKKPNKIEPNL